MLPNDQDLRLELKGSISQFYLTRGRSNLWAGRLKKIDRLEVQREALDRRQCERLTCPEGKVETRIPSGKHNKWFHCASGGVRKDACDKQCRQGRLSWVFPAGRKLASLRNTHISQRKTASQVDERESIELGNNDGTGVLKDKEGEGKPLIGKEEGVLLPDIKGRAQ